MKGGDMSAWNDASNLIEHMENQTGDFITVQKKMQLSQTEIIAYLRSDDNPWNMAHRKGYSVSGVDFDFETTTSEPSMGDEDEDAFATEEMENAEEGFVTTTTMPETTDGRDLETGSTQTEATNIVYATKSVTLGGCSVSDDCGLTEFCWEGTCQDTTDSDVCRRYQDVATDDGWEWICDDLYADGNFRCLRPSCTDSGREAKSTQASDEEFTSILTVNSIGIEEEYEDALKAAERRSLPAQTLDLEEAGLTITKELPKIEVTTTEAATTEVTNVETTLSNTTVAPTTAAKSGSFVIQTLAAAVVGLWLVAQC